MVSKKVKRICAIKVSLVKLERHEEAIGCFDKVIRIDPEDYVAWRNKGRSLKELGRDDKAKECFAKAKELR